MEPTITSDPKKSVIIVSAGAGAKMTYKGKPVSELPKNLNNLKPGVYTSGEG